VSAHTSELSLEELLTPAGRRSPWRRRGALIGAAVVLVVVVIVAFATDAIGSSGASYRTAEVTRRAVDAGLTSVATIEPVAQATVGFPISGTVESISVAVGDEVAAGTTMARLDTTSLEMDLHTAEADLTRAELTLENGLNGEKASSTPTGGLSPTNVSTASGTSDTRIVLVAASSDPALAAAQQAVLQVQHNVDIAIAAASTAYQNAVSVCTTDPPNTSVCQDALEAALDAQLDVQTTQAQLANALSAYDALLEQRAAQDTSPPAAAPSQGGGAPTTGGATTQAPTSADLVSYQKAVDAAASQVAAAEQSIEQATVTTPIAGQVVAVNMSLGESVSDPSTQNVIVQGAGGLEATTTVGVDDVATVKVGQRAYVTPDGSSRVLEGSVAAISGVPTSSDSTDYRVTIALEDPDASVDNGNVGTVTIVTEQSTSGLAVPTSAIGTVGNQHFVTVEDDGGTRRVTVEVDVVGREWTSITSGLTAGQEVVLADLSEPLPSSATQPSDNSGGPTFPGGGQLPTFGGPNR
jgi:multidrug efflux pump subunit AcrA (membrane-fusion protein)